MGLHAFAVLASITFTGVLICQIEGACREADFLPCTTLIRIQQVPFDKNILNVVFNVTNHGTLFRTCRAYESAMPCFEERLQRCGDKKQRQMLSDVSNTLKFFCSDESEDNKEEFLNHRECIVKSLEGPPTRDCAIDLHPFGNRIKGCRDYCSENPGIICLMKIWISEQGVCSLIDIESKCGAEAARFYQKLRAEIFDPDYPVLCDVGPVDTEAKRRKGLVSYPRISQNYKLSKSYAKEKSKLPFPNRWSISPMQSEGETDIQSIDENQPSISDHEVYQATNKLVNALLYNRFPSTSLNKHEEDLSGIPLENFVSSTSTTTTTTEATPVRILPENAFKSGENKNPQSAKESSNGVPSEFSWTNYSASINSRVLPPFIPVQPHSLWRQHIQAVAGERNTTPTPRPTLPPYISLLPDPEKEKKKKEELEFHLSDADNSNRFAELRNDPRTPWYLRG